MNIVLEILADSLRSAVLVSGLVVVMMMLIETINISSRGGIFKWLKRSRVWQVLVSAGLGAVPGCMGGFASVSLYSHGMISFGALVAMMIASSGDEAFVMLAMIPDKAWWITLVLLAIAITTGLAVDILHKAPVIKPVHCGEFPIHEEDTAHNHQKAKRHISWKRALMFAGVVAFIAALLSGILEHEEEEIPHNGAINLLSEEWMYWMFGAFSLIVLAVLIFGNDHFVEHHLWEHIVSKHLPSVFLWTFGVLIALGVGLEFFDISGWISDNTPLMILLATLVGIIPESGPHLVFVTLYAGGVIPLPVLLASCISQDGHASLPLIAESKKSFFLAKAANCLVALAVGFTSLLFA